MGGQLLLYSKTVITQPWCNNGEIIINFTNNIRIGVIQSISQELECSEYPLPIIDTILRHTEMIEKQ